VRLVPSVVSSSTRSDAERRVFRLLERTQLQGMSDFTAYHSLNISAHDYKLVGELDFVVLSTRCALVLEVKGGGVSCNEGIWTFTDRFGNDHRRSESPFQQARSGMYSLRKRLDERFGRGVVDSLVWGYAVVMPNTDFAVRSAEWEDPMVIDASTLRGLATLGEPLERLIAYWSTKLKGGPVGLSKGTTSEIGQFLRPDFDRVPSLRNRADELDGAMEYLTLQQYQRLDLIEENPRILCAGGAGTGKTFLAAELARREAALGRRVLFLTSTPVLTAFLRARVASPAVDIRTPEQLNGGQFDVAIIDEGQDLMNLDDLAALDSVLIGGLSDGRWRVFYDVNRQTGLVGRFEPAALELLRSCGAVPATLSRNCRNTHEIVLQTKLLTGGDLGTASAGHGPPVKFAEYDSVQQQVALIDEHLRNLRDEGVPPGDITVLSSKPLEDSVVRSTKVCRKGRLAEVTPDTAATWPGSSTTFSTVANFKGLENRFIVLTDMDSIGTTEAVNNLYVAMSRARTGLWVAVDQALQADLVRVSESNLNRVLAEATNEQQ
jgi:hypothetical protein